MGTAAVEVGGHAVRNHAPGSIPKAVKVAFTAFMAVLVPSYWHFYGPTNFVYFCDLALILTLIGIWAESALLVSMCAVGILAPQALWVADFAGGLVGHPIVGMTAYMFRPDSSLFLRGLSLFHGWLPFLLAYLVWRTGYDRRAWAAWSALAVAVLAFCWTFLPPPMPDAGYLPVNVNYVWGMDDAAAQTWMPPLAWLACLMVGIPLLLSGPTHLALKRLVPAAPRHQARGSARIRPVAGDAPRGGSVIPDAAVP